jgi:hypothetical protein
MALGATLAAAVMPGRAAAPAQSPAPASPAPASPAPVVLPPPTAPRGPLRPLAFPTTPRAFSAAETATLGDLVETMLPTTDTPGAKSAGVHWYLDDVAGFEKDLRDGMKRGIALADAKATQLHGAAYSALPAEKQDTVMEALSKGTQEERQFFALLKTRVIDAYYKSEMGLLGELAWVGHEFHTSFPGKCEHGDPLNHPRPVWTRATPNGVGLTPAEAVANPDLGGVSRVGRRGARG